MNTDKKDTKMDTLIPQFQFNYQDDGITHINIYSKGKTKLGQMLSHFYEHPYEHPVYGKFRSIENLWQYVSTGCKVEEFRDCTPTVAKQRSRQHLKDYPENFNDLIREANYQKIKDLPELRKMFIESELPFDHYYLMPDMKKGGYFVVRPRGNPELIEMFESLRMYFRKEENECTQANLTDVCNRTT